MHKRLLPLVFSLAVCSICRGEIQLVGVINGPEKRLFALSDSASGASSWRSLGEKFSEYQLSNFDPNESILVLTKSGAALKVKLAEGVIKKAESSNSTTDLDSLTGMDLVYALAEKDNPRVSDLLVKFYEVKKAQTEAKKEVGELEADLAKDETNKDKKESLAVEKQSLTGTTSAVTFLEKQLVEIAKEEQEKLKKQDKEAKPEKEEKVETPEKADK